MKKKVVKMDDINYKETAELIKSFITIPEYYKKFIDSTVNLELTPKICSPFRVESTPSFSYSREKNMWKDFGGTKDSGDVINLHKTYNKLQNYNVAIISLAKLLDIKIIRTKTSLNDLMNTLQNFDKKQEEREQNQYMDIEIKFRILLEKIEAVLKRKNNIDLYCKFDDLMFTKYVKSVKYEKMEQFYEDIK